MKLPSSAIHEADALAQGYKALTTPFQIPEERDSLNRAMQDLDKDPTIDYVLVGDPAWALSIWRKGMKEERDNTVRAEHSAGAQHVCTKRKSPWEAYEPRTL